MCIWCTTWYFTKQRKGDKCFAEDSILSLEWQSCVSVELQRVEEQSVINYRNYVIMLPWRLVIYHV